MRSDELIRTLGEQLSTTGGGRAAFGAPVTVGDRTVIPVARVATFWGAGAGGVEPATAAAERGGGGGGGVIAAWPIGAFEVSPEGTRFVPIAAPARHLAVAFGGLLVGYLLGRRAGRRR